MWSSARLHLIFRWIQCWWLEGDVKKTFVKCFFSFVQSQITNNIKGQVCFSSFSSLCFGVSEKGKGSSSNRGQFVDLTTLAAWCWGKPSGLVGTLCGGGCRLRRAVNAATEWAGWVWSWLWRPPESAVVESKPSSSSSPQQLSWKRCQSTKSTRSCTRTISGTTSAIHGNTIASVASPPQKLIISEATSLTHLRTSICSKLINSKPVKDHVKEKKQQTSVN